MIGVGIAVTAVVLLRRRSAATERTAAGPHLESMAEIATAFGGADDTASIARELLERVEPLVGVELSLLYVVDNDTRTATGVMGRDQGRPLDWFRDLTVDLDNEPSGVATAVFEAAPFAVYDVRASKIVSPRLAQATGARSAAFVPLLADDVLPRPNLERVQYVAASAMPATPTASTPEPPRCSGIQYAR